MTYGLFSSRSMPSNTAAPNMYNISTLYSPLTNKGR
jgi:hypothetical protein